MYTVSTFYPEDRPCPISLVLRINLSCIRALVDIWGCSWPVLGLFLARSWIIFTSLVVPGPFLQAWLFLATHIIDPWPVPWPILASVVVPDHTYYRSLARSYEAGRLFLGKSQRPSMDFPCGKTPCRAEMTVCISMRRATVAQHLIISEHIDTAKNIQPVIAFKFTQL